MSASRVGFSLFLSLLFTSGGPAIAARPPHVAIPAALDSRLPGGAASAPRFRLREPTAAQLVAAEQLRSRLPGLVIRWDGLSAVPGWIAATGAETLAGPDPRGAEAAARSFLRQSAGLLGLSPREIDALEVERILTRPNGAAHVRFIQRVGPLEVFGGRYLVNLAPGGGVGSAGGSLFSGIRFKGTPALGPAEALQVAARELYPEIPVDETIIDGERAGERRTLFFQGQFGFPPSVRLVLFPEAHGARLAWEVQVAEQSRFTNFLVLVDAIDGRTLWRRNLTLYADATILDAIFADPAMEEYSPPQYVSKTIPTVTAESPNGWIDPPEDLLSGNNADARTVYHTEPVLAGPGGLFAFPFNTLESAAVNAWWWVNDAHDQFYRLGFDEAAGNFQIDNFGRGGLGGDPVSVVAHAWGDRDNAFFNPRADGTPVWIDLLWDGCSYCDDHDGYWENEGERHTAFEREVVRHEFVHGVTTRMVGIYCLSGTQSGALGEGWSDALASSLEDHARFGQHSWYGNGFIRDLRQDLIYDDLCRTADGSCQIHADGLIWSGALWDLRQSMIALDPAGGMETFGRLVIDALTYTKCSPTMLDARDALLDADRLDFGSAHEQVIWNVFAARRMGDAASSTGDSDSSPIGDGTVPAGMECIGPAAPTGLSAAPDGANAIRLDYSASGAASVEIWREDLDNPLDRARRIAFTTDTTTYRDTTVQGGRSYRYHLVALGSAGIVCRSAASATADATATGICSGFPVFDFNLRAEPSLTGCGVTISWDAAQEACPGSGEPIVYNIYRGPVPGYEPSSLFYLAQTTALSFEDLPPDSGRTYYYTVLAQHGLPGDEPDLRNRKDRHAARWAAAVPTGSRTTVHDWDFESGPAGWVADNSNDPAGGWVLASPHGARYGGAQFAPDAAAGGSYAWVTGDVAAPASIAEADCDGTVYLASPVWDGTGGATILSFDYWNYSQGDYESGIGLIVDNGASTAEVFVDPYPGFQDYDGPARLGWQHAEIDLSEHIAPTSSMQVTFGTISDHLLSEFGIDNVRIESGAACDRAALTLESVAVDDAGAGEGNGNGLLEPGETVKLVIRLRNDGGATAFAPVGRVKDSSRELIVHEDAIRFPDIPPGGTGDSSGDGVMLTLAPGSSCADSLFLQLEIVDSAGTHHDELYWLTESGAFTTANILTDDFETDKGWFGDGTPGYGIWMRGDPVGTWDGTAQANPEDDSPNDAGTLCYVTDNGPIGGDVNANDVDGGPARLFSPSLDFKGYKRVRLSYDLWLYDGSDARDPEEDYGSVRAYTDMDGPDFVGDATVHWTTTGVWKSQTIDLTPYVPMISGVTVWFAALDDTPDNVLEMGIDNVSIDGDIPTCDQPPYQLPPSGVGDTLRVTLTTELDLSWQAPPAGAGHDPPAYYELFVSGRPDAGFALADTATLTQLPHPSDPVIEFYKITAVNSAGTSGDEPTP